MTLNIYISQETYNWTKRLQLTNLQKLVWVYEYHLVVIFFILSRLSPIPGSYRDYPLALENGLSCKPINENFTLHCYLKD